MQLDYKKTKAFLSALEKLSEEHNLDIDLNALAEAEKPYPNDSSFYLNAVFPHRSVSHVEELGEAASTAYPSLLERYAEASLGDFQPKNIELNADGWGDIELCFLLNGKKSRFKLSIEEDSDWFSDNFVKALNRFAKKINLAGRWVDFHNGDDACTSIYVPEAAQSRFKSLRKKYSTVSEAEDVSWTPELLESASADSLILPPALECVLSKEQLAERKKAWPALADKLHGQYDKGDVKIFERYYLKGAEPKLDNLWHSDPIPLVLRLWLHPDQSDESWRAITERVLSYRIPKASYGHIYRAIDISLSDSRKVIFRKEWFGEDYERIVRFLKGEGENAVVYRHKGERLYYYDYFRGARYKAQYDWLIGAGAESPRVFQDSAEWEYLIDHLCGDDFQRTIRNGDTYIQMFYFKKLLDVVVKYEPPVDGHSKHKQQLFSEYLSNSLNSRELPDDLRNCWESAKKGEFENIKYFLDDAQ